WEDSGGPMKSNLRNFLAIGLLLGIGLGIPPGRAAGGSGKAKDASSRKVPPPTTEPAPPLSLALRETNSQKNTQGGVATLSLEALSDVALDQVTLTIRVPSGVVFTDGTREKAWNSAIAPGSTLSLPFDLLVSADGKYILSGEATGSYQGKPVHR